MLLAINIGNTNTKIGVWDELKWSGVWTRPTHETSTASGAISWLEDTVDSLGLVRVTGAIAACVVPKAEEQWRQIVKQRLKVDVLFLRGDMDLGMPVRYEPPQSVGADRIANALGALTKSDPPIIVVDFGTATTLDVVSSEGAFVGGAIMPGARICASALTTGTAQLPAIEIRSTAKAIGRSTEEAILSGLVLGHASAIDGLILRMQKELGQRAQVFATGGASEFFLDVCQTHMDYQPNLTLEGLVEASRRVHNNPRG